MILDVLLEHGDGLVHLLLPEELIAVCVDLRRHLNQALAGNLGCIITSDRPGRIQGKEGKCLGLSFDVRPPARLKGE